MFPEYAQDMICNNKLQAEFTVCIMCVHMCVYVSMFDVDGNHTIAFCADTVKSAPATLHGGCSTTQH